MPSPVRDSSRRSHHEAPPPAARGPRAALAALVALAALAYVAYAAAASVPRFLLDELYYLEAGTSLALGDGLGFRDEGWGYGPGYPALIALVVRATSDQETTYDLVRMLGGLAYAGALVPVFALARRIVSAWWAVAVAGATAVLPATTYVSLVMTESVTFLVVAWTLLGMAIVLERPSAWGQAGVLVLLAVATALRTQMLALAAGWALAVVLVEVVPRARRPLREALARWWVTVAGAVVAPVVLAVSTLGSERGALGTYDVLVRSPSFGDLGWALVHQVGIVLLTLAVVPVVGATVVLAGWWPDIRRGDPRRTALAALTIALAASLLTSVVVFASSAFAVGSLHDRKLFYLYPLCLALCARWLADGVPRPTRVLGVSAAVVLVSFALLPADEIAAEGWLPQHEAPGTEVWGLVGRSGLPLGVVLLVFAAACLAAAVWLPRAVAVPVLGGLVVLVLAGNAAWAWRSALIDPAANGVAPRGERSWVDAAVGEDARVVLLLRAPGCEPAVERAGTMTLVFNRSALASVGLGGRGAARGDVATVGTDGADGAVVVAGEGPLRAGLVVATPTLALRGERVATGSPAGLVLWRTPGAVVLEGDAATLRDAARACEPAEG